MEDHQPQAPPATQLQLGEVQWSWVDFELGEDVRGEQRLEQDARWQSATADGRAHISWREYSAQHAEEFVGAIEDFHTVNFLVAAFFSDAGLFRRLNVETIKHIIDFALPGQGQLVLAAAAEHTKEMARKEEGEDKKDESSFHLCARCRPLFPFELESGAYNSAALYPLRGEIVLHDGKLARNGRRLTMNHKKYKLQRVWPQNATNADVCEAEVRPLLERAMQGYAVSLLCFGQTGTGKTYTLMASLQYALKIFEMDGTAIELTFIELHGKKSYDLLSKRKLVHLRSDENEVIHVRGARSAIVGAPHASANTTEKIDDCANNEPTNDDFHGGSRSAESWMNSVISLDSYESMRGLLAEAFQMRSSEVTERNPVSSRSHAVCVIKILSETNSGKLTFVDLAGSERNYETTKMTPAQHRESADINTALMALKDCFRAYHAQASGSRVMLRPGQHPTHRPCHASAPARAPYRASLLTRVLRECFVNCRPSLGKDGALDTVDRRHYTTIITTLSPTPMDSLHSINSLEHVVLMSPELVPHMTTVTVEVPLEGAALSHLPIESWSHVQVQQWLGTFGGGRFAQLALPPGLDGAGLMKLNMVSLSALFEGHLRAARQVGEGTAWVLDGQTEGRNNYLGRALWAALRREQQRQRVALQQDAALAL